ncbi:MAG: response regulator [Acidobacteria bacterium]|nr:response regulator [Acidobacteriota bacterium]MBI3472285.1 response regulator [Candidatus Solibacter usitatus]
MPRTVLIVEDTESTAVTLEIALDSLSGVNLRMVAGGDEAWQFVQRESVSAIITDLNMPRMDGFELIERVRRAERGARVPIIVVSGDTSPDTPERVRRLGADAYFAKPYSPAAVRETLERLLHESTQT